MAAAPAPPAKLAPAPKPAIPSNSPLLQPSQTLSGQQLATSAQQIANAQVQGPLTELAKQIAATQAQGSAAGAKTFGYYMGLAKQAQDGINQEKANSAGLNTTLQGIGQGTQQQLGQFGQQAQGGALGRMNALGLAGTAPADLAAETARQQGIGALNAGAFQAAGANQGANYTGNAISNLGTFDLRGQERLGDIGRATQLANAPLNSKIAALNASKGALTATALGSLRSQERNYQIAQQGLGIKQQTLATTAANDAAKNALMKRGQDITLNGQQLAQMRAGRTFQLDQAKFGAAQAKDMYLRSHSLGPYKPSAASALPKITPTGTPTLPPIAQQRVFSGIDTARQLIPQMQQPLSAAAAKSIGLPAGTQLSESQIRHYLAIGVHPAGNAKFTPAQIDAAYALDGWGYLTGTQIHELNLEGVIVGNRYRRGSVPQNQNTSIGGGAFAGAGNLSIPQTNHPTTGLF